MGRREKPRESGEGVVIERERTPPRQPFLKTFFSLILDGSLRGEVLEMRLEKDTQLQLGTKMGGAVECGVQVFLAGHRVNGFVLQQMLTQLAWWLPGDFCHAQETPVEPGREQVVEIVIERAQSGLQCHQPA